MNDQAFTRRLASPARESVVPGATRAALAADLWARRAMGSGKAATARERNIIIRRDAYRVLVAYEEGLL